MSDINKLQEKLPEEAEYITPDTQGIDREALSTEAIAAAFENMLDTMSEEELESFIMTIINPSKSGESPSIEPMRIAASKIFKKLIKY